MDPRSIVALTAGVSTPSTSRRLAERMSAATAAALDGPSAVRVIEVRDVAHDVVTATFGGPRSTALVDAIGAVTGADALVAVSPVFNGAVAGIFTSFVDLLPPGSLDGIPTAIGITGGSDRHSLVLDHDLRPLLTYLHAGVVPTGVHASSSDLEDGPRTVVTTARIARAGRELAAAASHRRSVGRSQDVELELAALLDGLG